MSRLLQKLLPLLLCLALLTAPAAAGFSDVPQDTWYTQAVAEMQEAGILSGYPDGTFRPGSTITACEYVKIAVCCAGIPTVPGQTSHWAAGYLQAALEAGWYDWDELPPTGERFDLPITRQLAVKILMRALFPNVRGDYTTESEKIGDFSALDGRYYEPVLAAYAAGIIQGDGEGNFRPTSGLSRAEACVIIQRALRRAGDPDVSVPNDPQPGDNAVPQPVETVKGGVSENGWLQVKGTALCNEAGRPVVLHGMSLHGLQWYGRFGSAQSIRSIASFGANLVRLPVYTEEGGYIADPAAMRKTLLAAADAAIANDLYVIIDWHILSDGNPMTHKAEAAAFFADIAARYKDCPAVLYEICNEPNGSVSWERDVKPYAEAIIPVIRAQSPKSVILVGSPTWSQDLHLAAQSPLKGENLMYTLHFYAGTHGDFLRQRIDSALAAGLPVFVSEWGTSRADGSGGVFLPESAQWLDFLDQRGISWANWSLCDKAETSAALRPGTSPNQVWTQSDLSESGKFVFSRF